MPLRVLRLAGRAGDTARSGANGQPPVTLGLAEALVLLSPGSAQPRPLAPGGGRFVRTACVIPIGQGCLYSPYSTAYSVSSARAPVR